jgi:hypothetical protein
MDMRNSLIRMLKQLLEDIHVLQQQGAGYYSCIPMTRRYNKLLEQARHYFGAENNLIKTFDDLPESDPKDPADKMKVVQGIRIEIGQLITLLDASKEEGA